MNDRFVPSRSMLIPACGRTIQFHYMNIHSCKGKVPLNLTPVPTGITNNTTRNRLFLTLQTKVYSQVSLLPTYSRRVTTQKTTAPIHFTDIHFYYIKVTTSLPDTPINHFVNFLKPPLVFSEHFATDRIHTTYLANVSDKYIILRSVVSV